MKYLFLCLMLFACGKDSGSSSARKEQQKETENSALESEGQFEAILRPLNYHVNGFIASGKAQVTISQSSVEFLSVMDDAQAVTHVQSVHVGNRCPVEGDDMNNDGFVDIEEAMRASGDEMVSLANHPTGQS